jgi:hypothetical protein
MPGYDGTGPNGTGPNGWGRGTCGEGAPRVGGRGFFGFRRNRGRGRGGFWGQRTGFNNEKDALEAEKGWLKQQLDAVTSRLNDIDETKK